MCARLGILNPHSYDASTVVSIVPSTVVLLDIISSSQASWLLCMSCWLVERKKNTQREPRDITVQPLVASDWYLKSYYGYINIKMKSKCGRTCMRP